MENSFVVFILRYHHSFPPFLERTEILCPLLQEKKRKQPQTLRRQYGNHKLFFICKIAENKKRRIFSSNIVWNIKGSASWDFIISCRLFAYFPFKSLKKSTAISREFFWVLLLPTTPRFISWEKIVANVFILFVHFTENSW